MLKELIKQDMIKFMKEKNKEAVTTIRMVNGAIKNKEIELKRDLTDDEVVTVVNKEVKQYNESLEFAVQKGDETAIQTIKNAIELLSTYLPEQLSDEEAQVILGFRNESETFWADLFKDTPVQVHITTDDGRVGTKGFPTAIMPDLINANSFTSVMTCGPMPMMKGVAQVAKELNVPCQVSLEERMGCGTGGCLGCACDGAGGKRYKVCKDGPVFPAEEVFF